MNYLLCENIDKSVHLSIIGIVLLLGFGLYLGIKYLLRKLCNININNYGRQ